MHYVFLTLAMVVPMMDFGFSLSVERGLAYALGGARSLAGQGVGDESGRAEPNLKLVGEVMVAARQLYRWLSLAAFVLLLVGGSAVIGLKVHETTHPAWTWCAWSVHLVALSLEIYSAYWVAVLRGLNRVTDGARWLSLGYGLKLGIALALLLAGAGLLAVPAAGLVAGVVIRWGAGREVARWRAGRGLPGIGALAADREALASVLRALWPNSWRLGVQILALFASALTLMTLCAERFGLAVAGEFGLSVHLINVSLGIAAVWTSVKWPVIAQYRMRGDLASIRRVLRPRYLLQVATFIALAGSAAWLAPGLLKWIGSDKTLLPAPLLAWLVVDGLGQLHFQMWTTLISTDNRIPALWPLVITQAAGLILVAVLVFGFGAGLEALVLTPLILGALFNYWWWVRAGVRMLDTTFLDFLRHAPQSSHGRS